MQCNSQHKNEKVAYNLKIKTKAITGNVGRKKIECKDEFYWGNMWLASNILIVQNNFCTKEVIAERAKYGQTFSHGVLTG